MKRRLRRYLIPEDIVELSDIYLATIVNVGFMWSGKTTLARKIAAKVEKKIVEKYKLSFIYVEGRRQSDVLSYFDDNPDELRNDYIFVMYEDAGRGFNVREMFKAESREQEKSFLEIRHEFKRLGFRKGILAIMYNIQRLEILGKTYRAVSPVTIFKTLPSTDIRDRRYYIKLLGRRGYKFLKAVTGIMYFGTYPRDPEVIDIFINGFHIDPMELDRNTVKRYAVVVYADDVRMITDFGPEIIEPRNKVIVKWKTDEQPWIPSTPKEKILALYWLYLGWLAAKEHYILHIDDLRKYARVLGLKFRNQYLTEIGDKARELADKAIEKITVS